MKLTRLLSVFNKDDLNAFIDSIGFNTLDDKNMNENILDDSWEYVGHNEQNASVIDMLESGEKGIIERITNGIDAVLQKQMLNHNIINANNPEKIVKIAYPKYYDHYQNIIAGHKSGNQSYDASDQVTLAVNDGERKSTPTFDIVDLGTGIQGDDFSSTILALHGKNKVKKDTSYMIGAFGQGGSTSLAFAYATIIVSKVNHKYYFTIVKKVHLKDYKNHAYFYLSRNNKIFEIENDYIDGSDVKYINDFLDATSGTLVRMIDLEISSRYRERDIAKPRMLGDYFNTELFGTPLPIRMIENRKHFIDETKHNQNRYVYGTKLKLKTWKRNVFEEYSGYIEIVHNERTYKIDFYIILPTEKSDWVNDNKCKETYEMFNIHEKPIIFTVNGQYINGENFTKLANRGLSFLKYRLLAHIDLDMLGNEKYQFFTTDRSRIKNTDLTAGFVDKVIKELSENKLLIEINRIISEMSIEKGLDADALENLKNNVKSAYQEFLHPTKNSKGYIPNRGEKPLPANVTLNDYISDIIISNTKPEYFSDENVRIILKTDAYKDINKNANIKAFINTREYYIDSKSIMNGRIQYVLNNLEPGEYDLQFIYYYNNNSLSSNIYSFIVTDKRRELEPKGNKTELDINIDHVVSSEAIVSVAKNIDQKRIDIKLCLKHDELKDTYAGKSENEISQFKIKISQPICLMALYMDDIYDELEPDKQNKLIKSLVTTIDKGM